MPGPRVDVQAHAQRLQHFQGSEQGRVSLLAHGLVAPSAGDVRVAGDVAQRFVEQANIVRHLLDAGLKETLAVFTERP